MVIKTSSAAEIRALVEALGSRDDVQRESASARLAVIGPRAVERLTQAYKATTDRHTRCAILRTLEAIGDHRSAPLARQAIAEGGDIAVAACGVLRSLLGSTHGSSSAEALDTLISTALDPTHHRRLRLAAIEAMPAEVRARVAEALGADRVDGPQFDVHAGNGERLRADAIWTDATEGRLPDDASTLRETVETRAASAPLNVLRRMIDAVRTREVEAAQAEQEGWRSLRGSLHQALALRGSRVALYDLRETLASTTEPLPVSFLAALHVLGDDSCLEPLAAAWSRANAADERWRHQLASAFHAIVRREKITRRHKIMVRLKAQGSGLFEYA
jgi:hypothetical protein